MKMNEIQIEESRTIMHDPDDLTLLDFLSCRNTFKPSLQKQRVESDVFGHNLG